MWSDVDTTPQAGSASDAVRSRVLAAAARLKNLPARGETCDRSLLRSGLHGEAEIRKAVAGLLGDPDPATALIASDSLIGLAVVGAPWARLVTPPITVVAQPTYDIAHAAADSAMSRRGRNLGGWTNCRCRPSG